MFSLEITIFLALFLALFIVSIFADRVLHADELAEWSFFFSGIFLFLAVFFLMLTLFIYFIGKPPSEVIESGYISFFKWMVSKAGGWSGVLAAYCFCFAMAAGVMYFLGWFVNAVEQNCCGFLALIGLEYGIIFMVGFFVFLKGLSIILRIVAIILGIVATIIGIMVGLRKLASRNTG